MAFVIHKWHKYYSENPPDVKEKELPIFDPNNPEILDSDLKEKALDAFTRSGFAVSGKELVKKDGSKEPVLDTDAKSAIGIFRLLYEKAGREMPEVEVIPAGEFRQGKVNIDTGYEYGGAVLKGVNPDEEGKSRLKSLEDAQTLMFDHHGLDAPLDTSATAMVYKTLTELGWLERDPVLDKLVEFVTYEDNRSFPNEQKLYFNSYKMLLGLHRVMSFETMYKFFQDGHSADEELNEEDLKKYGLEKESRLQKVTIERDGNRIAYLEKQGCIINSKKYGKILVDIPNKGRAKRKYRSKVMSGFAGARAHGYDGYVIYDPVDHGLFISTSLPLEEEFSQGRLARKTMWVKNKADGDLQVSLMEIVQKLGGSVGAVPDGKFKQSVLRSMRSEAA